MVIVTVATVVIDLVHAVSLSAVARLIVLLVANNTDYPKITLHHTTP